MRKGPGTNKNGLIGALDVGSSKICCFVAEMRGERPRVIGIGQQASRGLRNGAVIDMDSAETAILNAVHAAEQMAGDTISEVVVSLSAGHPHSRRVGVEVAIAGHAVDDRDLRRALSHASRALGEDGLGTVNGHHRHNGHNGSDAESRQLIHTVPLGYTIDGSRGIRDPRGMVGERLGVDIHLIDAAAGAVRNLATCIQRCHLEVGGFVLAPYAAGIASLVEDERALGVTVIDMGGGTTGIAVFSEGSLLHSDVVPVGGQHVTNDIARGLSTPVVHAERMKTLYGHAMAAAVDDRETIEVPQVGEENEGGVHQVPRSLLTGIIQPRLEETFELVRSRLETSGFDKIAGRRVVLTGGASQLPGVRDMAALVLDKQVRVGRPLRVLGLAESTTGPAYAVAAGLITYAIETEVARGDDGLTSVDLSTDEVPAGLMGRVGHWLREHF